MVTPGPGDRDEGAARELSDRRGTMAPVTTTEQDLRTQAEETLTRLPEQQVHSFDSLAHADAQARRLATELVEALAPA